MTNLEKSMRTTSGKKRPDCRTLELWHFFCKKCKFGTVFFPTLDFIRETHTLQFWVYALPIRFWQVLMKLKNPKSKFWSFLPDLCFIWILPIFQFLVYALPNKFWQVLMKLKNPLNTTIIWPCLFCIHSAKNRENFRKIRGHQIILKPSF